MRQSFAINFGARYEEGRHGHPGDKQIVIIADDIAEAARIAKGLTTDEDVLALYADADPTPDHLVVVSVSLQNEMAL